MNRRSVPAGILLDHTSREDAIRLTASGPDERRSRVAREVQPGDSGERRDSVLSNAFHENAARIYRFIYAKVGNQAAAEDLTSQVFLKAVRWLGEDHSATSVRAWLYATARSTIVDYWREQSQFKRVPLDDALAPLFIATDPEEEVARSRERARRILDALPEREGAVLRLRFLHGYTAAEIGRALGIEPGNVRVIQLRALRRAATLLIPELDTEKDPSVV
jgi:RNA polymerase sigma-70 factor (ECF subfamily)